MEKKNGTAIALREKHTHAARKREWERKRQKLVHGSNGRSCHLFGRLYAMFYSLYCIHSHTHIIIIINRSIFKSLNHCFFVAPSSYSDVVPLLLLIDLLRCIGTTNQTIQRTYTNEQQKTSIILLYWFLNKIYAIARDTKK